MEAMIQHNAAGAPWLDLPMTLDGAREPMYNLTDEQFAFVSQYWLFWYEADHHYALPTIALFLAIIAAFALAKVFTRRGPTISSRPSGILYRRVLAGCRYLSYKSWRISSLHWYSPAAGIWLVGLLGAIFFLCMVFVPKPYYWPNTETVNYGDSPPLATRSGWMSLACLPFVLVLAAKENPISLLTGVPHDQLMVFHRWAAWAMFALALLHTFPFIVYHIQTADIEMQWEMSVCWWTGVVALLAQAWLQFMSIGFIRNAFYEIFRAFHYIMGALFWVFLLFHCDSILTSWQYLTASAVLYTVCFGTSQLRTWAEHGIAKATIELLPSGAICIRIPSRSNWYPGQHIFVRFLSKDLHSLSSHPFTICSLPLSEHSATGRKEELKNEMVMFIRPRGGMTRRLESLARQRPGRKIRVMLDGPYGGLKHKTLGRFDRSLVIAGGAGAGFTLPVIESFLQHAARGSTTGTQSVTTGSPERSISQSTLRMILAVKTEAEREWYTAASRDLLGLYPESAELVKVEIYVTGTVSSSGKAADQSKEESDSTDSHLHVGGDNDKEARQVEITTEYGHRPDLPTTIRGTLAGSSGGSTAIVVCGPSSMLFDVRQVAAAAQLDCLSKKQQEVYLYSEHFSW